MFIARPIRSVAVTLLLLGGGAHTADAVEFYGAVGLPGLSVGVAQSLGSRFGLRADYGGLPGRDIDATEGGIEYEGRSRLRRLGLFADWFVGVGEMRLTGGVTVNDVGLDLSTRSDASSIQLGGQSYPLQPGDRLDARVEFSRVTPYLGIGWGHRRADPGWAWNADLGVSFGRVSVSATPRGALAAQPGVQQAIEAELVELRSDVDDLRFVPQLSVGISYRF